MIRTLWRTSPVLVLTAVVMLVALVAFVAGLALDPRVITGAPAWLKPAKFAFSTAFYALTLAWVFRALPTICSDRLPGGYASFGFIMEPGHDLPVGVSRRRRIGIDHVGLNCAVCHSGTVRDTPDPSVVCS